MTEFICLYLTFLSEKRATKWGTEKEERIKNLEVRTGSEDVWRNEKQFFGLSSRQAVHVTMMYLPKSHSC